MMTTSKQKWRFAFSIGTSIWCLLFGFSKLLVFSHDKTHMHPTLVCIYEYSYKICVLGGIAFSIFVCESVVWVQYLLRQ